MTYDGYGQQAGRSAAAEIWRGLCRNGFPPAFSLRGIELVIARSSHSISTAPPIGAPSARAAASGSGDPSATAEP